MTTSLPQAASEACDILLVDDDARIRDAYRWFLEQEGHRVRFASDGKGALAQMKTCAPHIVLLDVHMSDMTGLQVLEAKNRDARLAEIPVVMVTALPLPRPKHPCVLAVFEKMDDVELLLRAVRPHCGCPLHRRPV